MMSISGLRQIVITGLLAAAVLAAVAVGSVWRQMPVEDLTRDVSAVARLHPLTGALSNLGILLWCASASVCAFAACVVGRTGPGLSRGFLLSSALLSAYLMLDDLFLIHEDLVPRHLGLPETAVLAALGTSALTYFACFARTILQTRWVTLAAAIGLLGLSVVVDAHRWSWMWRLGTWSILLEDGLKWAGISFWCSYFLQTSALALPRPAALVRPAPRLPAVRRAVHVERPQSVPSQPG